MNGQELAARESIRHTLASYNMAGDRLRSEEFLAVFTDDAVFESTSHNGGDFRCEGIAAIREWTRPWDERRMTPTNEPSTSAPPTRGSDDASPPTRKFVRHHLTTSLITFTSPTTADVRTYFAVYTPSGPDHCGVYSDQFREVGDRWLICRRAVRTEWLAPDSAFAPR